MYHSRCLAHLLVSRDLQQALADCDQALRLLANDVYLDSRGLVHLRLGNLNDAIADYDGALKVNPKLASSLYGRGIARLRKKDAARSKADIAAAMAIQSDIADVFKRYGVTP